MCVVGKTTTAWYRQASVRGGGETKVGVGHWPDMPQVEARRMAADALAAMRRSEDPGEAERAQRARSTTLADAVEVHLAGRDGRSPRKFERNRYTSIATWPGWMPREVEAISGTEPGT